MFFLTDSHGHTRSHRSTTESVRSSRSSTAKKYGKWTNLGPAKTKFTKKATKAKRLIKEATTVLGNPAAPDFVMAVQDCYRKLSEFTRQLEGLTKVLEQLLQQIEEVISDKGFGHTRKSRRDSTPLFAPQEPRVDRHTVDEINRNNEVNKNTTSLVETPILTKNIIPTVDLTQTTTTQKPIAASEQKSILYSSASDSQLMPYSASTSDSSETATTPTSQHTTRTPAAPVDLGAVLQQVLAPITNNLENLYQKIEQLQHSQRQTEHLSRTVEQLANAQQQNNQAQKVLISSYKTLQYNLDTLQDQLEQQAEHSLHSLPSSGKYEQLSPNPDKIHDSFGRKTAAKDDRFNHHSNFDRAQPRPEWIPELIYHKNTAPEPELSPTDSKPQDTPPQPIIQSPSPTGPSPQNFQSSHPTDIGMILQTVKPFDGTAENYSLFITRFNSLVHNNPTIDVVLKQNILIGLLEGDSKELITSDELSEWAYNNLRDNLERVYNQQTDRRKQLMEGYRKLPFHQSDFDQMDRNVMKHICYANSLQKCGIEINDPFIISTFIDKLPSSILRQVVRRTRNRMLSFIETATLIQTLIAEDRDVQGAELRKKEATQVNEIYVTDVNNTSNKFRPTNKGHGKIFGSKPSKTIWRSAPCAFCTETHETRYCPMTITQKQKAVETNQLCSNCLRNNHQHQENSYFGTAELNCNNSIPPTPSTSKPTNDHNGTSPQAKSSASQSSTQQCSLASKSLESIQISTSPSDKNEKSHRHILDIEYENSLLATNSEVDTITVNLSIVADPDYNLPFIQLQTPTGALLNALVDCGATTSIISRSATQKLRCPVEQQKMINFKGLNSSTGPQKVNFYRLDILDRSGKIWHTIVPEFDQLPTTVKAPIFTEIDKNFLQQQKIEPKTLMALKRFDGQPVDMIIGNNLLTHIMPTSHRLILPSGRIVEETAVGYITHPSPAPDALKATSTKTQFSNSEESIHFVDPELSLIRPEAPTTKLTDAQLDQLLEQSWRLEVLGIETPTVIQGKQLLNQELVAQFKASAVLDANNFLHVQFPFNGQESALDDNYTVAASRLASLVNKQLQCQSDRDTYNDIIHQQLVAGIIELVPENEKHIAPHYYIPHKVVIKPDSQTTKLRIVLDASSHMKNEKSLNDCIHPGPSILKSILGILIRSRTKPLLMIADLEKAFHQVRVQSHHRNATKFLWLKNHNLAPTPDNIITYRFTRLPFGITASPFLLAITIIRYMELNPEEIHNKIVENLYVDNVAFTPDSLTECLEDYKNSKNTFTKMHMNLREFLCNSKEVMEQIPDTDKAKSSSCKLLGHKWDSVEDTLTISIAIPPEGIPTKRQLASFQASTYDPLGLVSPIMVQTKSLMAKVWKEKIKWRDQIPTTLISEWEAIKTSFLENSYTFPRQITPRQDFTKASLVLFSDASKDHYAACAYLRFEYPEAVTHSQLIYSRTRIKPAQSANLTIPRMELLGVFIASSAAATISMELNVPLSSITFFCDNTAVLHWIVHQQSGDKWVQNRVTTIANTTKELEAKNLKPSFRYVPTDQNPADIASRGATLAQLKNNELWHHGPTFLKQDFSKWPKPLEDSPEEARDFHCYTLQIDKQPFPDHTGEQSTKALENYESLVPYSRTNSLMKLVSITQKVIRWIHKLLKRRNTRYPNTPYIWKTQLMKSFALSYLQGNEVALRITTLKFIIQDHYHDAEQNLGISPPDTPNIQKHEDGCYHFHNSYVNKKHPNMPKSLIYIIHKHRLARLIALDSHQSLLHQGPKDMASDIQQKYWIKGVTTLTRSIRKECTICKRKHGPPYTYPFATALPGVRTQACRPFQHIGLDYFGPIIYKTETGASGKLWAMLTTCLVTRAVHLEVVPDNSTSSFLLAMRRVIGRRGTPKTILSDNAPAFTLGYSMMNADIKTLINSSQTLTSYLASKEIEVKQITPFAPWQGGVYERIVGITKSMFYKIIGRLQLSYLEVETLLIECEGSLSRPPVLWKKSFCLHNS